MWAHPSKFCATEFQQKLQSLQLLTDHKGDSCFIQSSRPAAVLQQLYHRKENGEEGLKTK